MQIGHLVVEVVQPDQRIDEAGADGGQQGCQACADHSPAKDIRKEKLPTQLAVDLCKNQIKAAEVEQQQPNLVQHRKACGDIWISKYGLQNFPRIMAEKDGAVPVDKGLVPGKVVEQPDRGLHL